jgi:hypothetical protein
VTVHIALAKLIHFFSEHGTPAILFLIHCFSFTNSLMDMRGLCIIVVVGSMS